MRMSVDLILLDILAILGVTRTFMQKLKEKINLS